MSTARERDAAAQLLTLEARAKRRLVATARLTIDATAGHPAIITRAALSAKMTDAVVDIRGRVRSSAAEYFTRATGIETEPSGADDTDRAAKAGAAYARAWWSGYQGGGGTSGGGGSTDAWGAARSKIDRIAAYEVAHAWNDEQRRDRDAFPQFKFTQRWCAILDVYLCKRCRRMNGKRADINGQFAEGWPPLHPDCRCLVVTAIA